MRPIQFDYAPTALDRDGIALAQTTAGAADLTLAGVLASGGVATLGEEQHVTLYSAGNLSARTVTIYGRTRDGVSISETLTGPNATTISSTLNFKYVDRVAASGALGTNIEVGVDGLGATRPIVLDYNINPEQLSVLVETRSGSPAYTLQSTLYDPFQASFADDAVWIDSVDMAGATGNTVTNRIIPARAVRINVTTTGAIRVILVQSGNLG